MIGSLSEFLSYVATLVKTHSIELMQIHIQRELVSDLLTALQQAYSHSEQVVLLTRV